MKQILIIEDDAALANLVRIHLHQLPAHLLAFRTVDRSMRRVTLADKRIELIPLSLHQTGLSPERRTDDTIYFSFTLPVYIVSVY